MGGMYWDGCIDLWLDDEPEATVERDPDENAEPTRLADVTHADFPLEGLPF